PRDHTADRRMLEAPRQRPLRHRHAGRDFFPRDLPHLTQLLVDLLLGLAGTKVIAGKMRTGLVFAAQETACQRHARENAELVLHRVREIAHLRTLVEAVVNYLKHLDLCLLALPGLPIVRVAADR